MAKPANDKPEAPKSQPKVEDKKEEASDADDDWGMDDDDWGDLEDKDDKKKPGLGLKDTGLKLESVGS